MAGKVIRRHQCPRQLSLDELPASLLPLPLQPTWRPADRPLDKVHICCFLLLLHLYSKHPIISSASLFYNSLFAIDSPDSLRCARWVG
jgi:hypothetical protein